MPILRGAVTFSCLKVEPLGDKPVGDRVASGLLARAFRPLDLKLPDERAAGFVELEDRDRTHFSIDGIFYGEHALFSYRVDELKIHAATVADELARWAKAFEHNTGRPPGRREKADAKAEIRHTLRARSPVLVKTHDVSWNLATGELQVWSATRSVVDEVQAAVEQAFAVKLVPITPVTVAAGLGIPDRALAPTPELFLGTAASSSTDEDAEVEQGKAREQFLRGRAYLGREFLTWLLWRSESGEPLLEHAGLPVTALLADRLTLRGIAGDVVEETLRGASSPYSPLVRRSLDRGLLVSAAHLRLFHGERYFAVALDAETLTLRAGKLPALLTMEEDDQLAERLALAEELALLVQLLLLSFLRLRASPAWGAEVVPAMKRWMAP